MCTLTLRTVFPAPGLIFSSIIRITIPLSSRPRRPARPLIWIYSPDDIWSTHSSQTVNLPFLCNRKNLSQQHGASILGCEPIDCVLGVFCCCSNQINIATFVHQMGHVCVSHLVEKGALFIWFEQRTPSTPCIGSHTSMLDPCCWLKFF